MIKKQYVSILLFILGFGIFMTTRASRIIPYWSVGILIAPVFILALARSLSGRKAGWLIAAGFILSCNIAMWGLFEMETQTASLIYNIIRNSIMGLLFSIPYIADRSLYRKIDRAGGWSTLSFPVAQTAVLFLISLEGPFDGDMISAIYSGFGGLAVRQIASLAGLFGFVFIYSWIAAVVNYIWEKRFKWVQIKPAVVSILVVLAAIAVFGGIKSSPRLQNDKETVKAAAIFLLPEAGKEFDYEGLFSRVPSDYELTLSKIEALTREAVSEGVKIAAFQESAIKINKVDEDRMIDDFAAIAAANRVYFSIGYGVFPDEGKGWNKAVLISDRGEVGVNYRKRYLLGFGDIGETLIYNKGPEVIQSIESPYGKIGVSICRDMSFPTYARQAGKQQIDIMLNPSYDVPKSGGAMYSLRAVENGFTMIRPVYNGYSYAVDSSGRLLASMDSDETKTGIMYTEVSIRGGNTLYSKVGDLFGWFCVIGFLGFFPFNIVLLRRRKKGHDESK